MNMYCEDCGRLDICLCHVATEDPTESAIAIMEAARDQALADEEDPAAARILSSAIACVRTSKPATCDRCGRERTVRFSTRCLCGAKWAEMIQEAQ